VELVGVAIRQVFEARSERLADASSLSAAQRRLVTAVACAPALFTRPSRTLEGALDDVGVPSRLAPLVAWLGWLAEDLGEVDRAPTVAEQLDGVRLPEGLARSTAVDVAAMLARFYPWHRPLLEAVADRVDWERVSANPGIPFDDALLTAFADRWSWWWLGRNRAVRWDEARLERWADWLHWGAVSARTDVPWSEALLERYADRWDWGVLSANPALPWSAELITRYGDEWSWHLLSQNAALPWASGLRHRFRRWYPEHLSANDGLGWTPATVARRRAWMDPGRFCRVTTFPWTEAFLVAHSDWLYGWEALSANPALPWSGAFIARHASRWTWEALSRNPGLPWSRGLVRSHSENRCRWIRRRFCFQVASDGRDWAQRPMTEQKTRLGTEDTRKQGIYFSNRFSSGSPAVGGIRSWSSTPRSRGTILRWWRCSRRTRAR